MVAQPPQPVGQRWVVGGQRATLAGGQGLSGVEGEARDVAERARAATVGEGTERAGRILDHRRTGVPGHR